MAFLSNFLNDKQVAKRANLIIDQTNLQYRERSDILSKIVPVQIFDSFNFLAILAEEINPAATIVAPEQEIPLTRAGKFDQLQSELAKIVVKHEYSEKLQKLMYEALQMADLKGVPLYNSYMEDGSIKTQGANNDLASLIFKRQQQLGRACYDRLDALAYDGLFYGEYVTSVDPISKVETKINFKDSAATYNHFPAPLTATGNATAKLNRWSDYENANGLENLWDALYTYMDTNGFAPDYILMSLKTYNHLLSQKSTKDAVTQVRGMSVGVVAPEMLDVVLRARMLPPIQVVNDRYRTFTAEGTTQDRRYVPDGYFAFAKYEMGRRAVGLTLESSMAPIADGFMPDPKPGLAMRTWEVKYSPPIDATQATLSGLAVYMNPKLFYAQKVD